MSYCCFHQLEDQIEAFQQELTEMKKAAAICEKQTADVKSSISQKKSANVSVVRIFTLINTY